MNQNQLNYMLRHPTAAMRFNMTGQLPRMVVPDSPLIRLLEQISPGDRAAIRGLTVGPLLGYAGSRLFGSAEQALRWCKPAQQVIERESFPAESWRIKTFARRLYLDELVFNSAFVPDELLCRYQSLFRLPRQALVSRADDSIEVVSDSIGKYDPSDIGQESNPVHISGC